MNQSEDVTGLVIRYADGDRRALDELTPILYSELGRLARLHRYKIGVEMDTISVVHEAYLRLIDRAQVDARSRGQFFALASAAMRSVVIDRARRLSRQKRGGDLQRVELAEHHRAVTPEVERMLALDVALDRLRALDERMMRIVECRFFGGLTVEETAEALEVSTPTVKRGWRFARNWLFRELGGGDLGAPT